MTEPVSPRLRELDEQLACLQQTGAARQDPVRFRYLESLIGKYRSCGRDLSPSQYERVQKALSDCQARLDQACSDAQAVLATVQADTVQGAADLNTLTPLFERGEFNAVLRQGKALQRSQPSRLARLHQALQGQDMQAGEVFGVKPVTASPASDAGDANAPRRELKALTRVRAAQAKMALDQRISDAIARTPEDAGPLNPHRLVTRAVKQMQQVSPHYLHRFVGYVDTLMALERLAKKH